MYNASSASPSTMSRRQEKKVAKIEQRKNSRKAAQAEQ
jgi:hypothetical protein